jgi:histone-lysine N-methyltransferase SETMAR
MLEVQRDQAWHDIVTLDESWFYLSTDHELIWPPRDETVPEGERYAVQSKKLTLIEVWNPRGFDLIDILAKGSKFNGVCCVTEILSPLSKWRSAGAKGDERNLIIHTDNARLHTTQLSDPLFGQNKMKTARHPPYSADLAPSDCRLFGYVNGCLASLSFESADELIEATQGALESIERATLQPVFLEWMHQLRKCITISGEYTD